jgi:mannose-6-phosphate isomerase-like protein (cupin superfamily)
VAGYTKLNLKQDVQDSAAEHGLPLEMQARFPGADLETEQAQISHQRYGPNFRQPFGHKHKTQEEIYVVLEGSGKLALDDEVIEVEQWDAIRVPSDTTRCFEGGPEGIEILAIGAPAGGPKPSADAEPIPGWWPE